ncbi:extracellular solute-binding protein [Deinococcus multiflagellatus]|uniref:Extracellular solute-binding protein n=1 Tax=Deinococcus multiflagellatus TaxID=1656887 RepID=A0ABW1ZH03_9DEIO|nr:extracellular solute-binding protein [Deinococcus multiflagellatus]MBZ9711882.1 extracellular solute-binding protein [Deinococcus multiflagellatus]
MNLSSAVAVKLAQKKPHFALPLSPFPLKGKVLGVPWDWAPRVVAHTTALFRMARLAPNVPPRTIQTLMAGAKQIKDETGLPGWMPNIHGLKGGQARAQ